MATAQLIPNVRRREVAAFDRPLDLPPSDPQTHHIRWTREAAYFLVDSGLIDGSRYELLDGKIVEKVKKRPHTNSLGFVQEWAVKVFPLRHYQFESPVTVAAGEAKTNEPEPDAALLNRPFSEFTETNPMPADVLLLIEVAHSTLDTDLDYKAGLYARAGYREYWVLDVENRKLHVHRDLNATKGEYKIRVYEQDDAVSPLAAPHASVTARNLLPLI